MKLGIKYVTSVLIISSIWSIIFGHDQIYGMPYMVLDAQVPKIDYLYILDMLIVLLTFILVICLKETKTKSFLKFVSIVFVISFLFKDPINIKTTHEFGPTVASEYSMLQYILLNPITFICYLIGNQLRFSSFMCIIMLIIRKLYFKITKKN